MSKNKENLHRQFSEDIKKGLTSTPKYLDSKYFYDEKGSQIFQQIMEMPEYYLTDCEFEILKSQKEAITEAFKSSEGFDLIELGAGDATKTKILLRHWSEKGVGFKYLPIDINPEVLETLSISLQKELPDVVVEPLTGTYFGVLKKLSGFSTRKKIIMVLGSNIGNLLHDKAIDFLKNIAASMNKEDLLFIGFDQKKDPQIILEAYSDKAGITESFNKNLLHRINRDLGGNFEVENFQHWVSYNPQSGTCESFLISKKTAEVHIKQLDLTVHFEPYEAIHLEISQKYDDSTVAWLAGKSGLEIVQEFTDSRKYYKDYLLRVKP